MCTCVQPSMTETCAAQNILKRSCESPCWWNQPSTDYSKRISKSKRYRVAHWTALPIHNYAKGRSHIQALKDMSCVFYHNWKKENCWWWKKTVRFSYEFVMLDSVLIPVLNFITQKQAYKRNQGRQKTFLSTCSPPPNQDTPSRKPTVNVSYNRLMCGVNIFDLLASYCPVGESCKRLRELP